MSDDKNSTPAPIATSPRKKEAQKTEFWTSTLAAVATVFSAMTTKNSVLGTDSAAIVSVIGLALIVGTYAYFKTGLSASKPGLKSPAFWTAIVSIVGSVAMAIGEASIPGLSPTVSKVAAIIGTAVIAAGYTIYRWNAKTIEFRSKSKQS